MDLMVGGNQVAEAFEEFSVSIFSSQQVYDDKVK